jgi:hypothetical protein
MFAVIGRGLGTRYTPHFHRTGDIRRKAVIFPIPETLKNFF